MNAIQFGREGANRRQSLGADRWEAQRLRILIGVLGLVLIGALLGTIALRPGTGLLTFDIGRLLKSPLEFFARKPPEFSIPEKPFLHLSKRTHTKKWKRGTFDRWEMRGVARFGAPSFYVGVWESKRSRKLRYDIHKQIKRYNTLASWGTISPLGAPHIMQTAIGKFERLRFQYKPEGDVQHCSYFSSVGLPNGAFVRGHYCAKGSRTVDDHSLNCLLSSIISDQLPIEGALKSRACQAANFSKPVQSD